MRFIGLDAYWQPPEEPEANGNPITIGNLVIDPHHFDPELTDEENAKFCPVCNQEHHASIEEPFCRNCNEKFYSDGLRIYL